MAIPLRRRWARAAEASPVRVDCCDPRRSYEVDGVELGEGPELPLGDEPDAGVALDDDVDPDACAGVDGEADCDGGGEAGVEVETGSTGAVDVIVLP